jgi:hypothetical protein
VTEKLLFTNACVDPPSPLISKPHCTWSSVPSQTLGFPHIHSAVMFVAPGITQPCAI